MINYNQSTFYFNVIKTQTIDNNLIQILHKNNWHKKNIVFNMQMYMVYFLIYKERLFIKTIDNYNTDKFKNIFHLNLMNWFYTGKIVEIVDYK